MSEFNRVVPLYVSSDPADQTKLFRSIHSSEAASYPEWVSGDKFLLRLYFRRRGPTATSPTEPVTLSSPWSIVVAGKERNRLDGPILFQATDFHEGEGEDEVVYYEAPLNLNTETLATALEKTNQLRAVVDIEIRDLDNTERLTIQTRIDIRKQAYQGNEALPPDGPDPYPLASELQLRSERGEPDGYAGLDGNGQVPDEYLFNALSRALYASNAIYCDAFTGDDGTGQRGNPLLPFETVAAAMTVAQPGDIVYLGVGTWDIQLKDGVTIYSLPGAIIDAGNILDGITEGVYNFDGYTDATFLMQADNKTEGTTVDINFAEGSKITWGADQNYIHGSYNITARNCDILFKFYLKFGSTDNSGDPACTLDFTGSRIKHDNRLFVSNWVAGAGQTTSSRCRLILNDCVLEPSQMAIDATSNNTYPIFNIHGGAQGCVVEMDRAKIKSCKYAVNFIQQDCRLENVTLFARGVHFEVITSIAGNRPLISLRAGTVAYVSGVWIDETALTYSGFFAVTDDAVLVLEPGTRMFATQTGDTCIFTMDATSTVEIVSYGAFVEPFDAGNATLTIKSPMSGA